VFAMFRESPALRNRGTVVENIQILTRQGNLGIHPSFPAYSF